MARRKPPLLAAMDGDPPPVDRRRAFDARMREAGNVKVTVWCSDGLAPLLKLLAGMSTHELTGVREMVQRHVEVATANLERIRGASSQ